jgi:hypothetical protein
MCIPLLAQTPLSSEEYEKELLEFQNRDKKLREQIAQEQAVIFNLKKNIASSQQHIKEIQQKKLSILGITSDDVSTTADAITLLQNNVTGLLNYSDQRFLEDSSKVPNFRMHVVNLHSNPATRMPELSKKFKNLSQLVDQCEKRLNQLLVTMQTNVQPEPDKETGQTPEPDEGTSYTVKEVKGDPETLFSIAQKIYGDPLQWRKLYKANKATIDSNFKKYNKSNKVQVYSDPSNLIFPGQVLTIPR